VGQVIGLIEERDRRAERERAMAAHPSLRWVAGRAFYVAHRKDGVGAACGAQGDLVLAPPGVPLCIRCYPLADREAYEVG
jgi:hypothetical protein